MPYSAITYPEDHLSDIISVLPLHSLNPMITLLASGLKSIQGCKV